MNKGPQASMEWLEKMAKLEEEHPFPGVSGAIIHRHAARIRAMPPSGVISAFRAEKSAEENEAAHGALLDVLLRNGFAPSEARGQWNGLPELCWVVPLIPLSELVELASDFGQEAVVYVEDGASRIIPV